ncbi:hypothetical protein B0T25DRAFT_543306 [Lasiosphaeria hispida]|uniref:Uncharacterized protein n=1 Tax=Lasiosphaeria hispida TaxID=260671 RepID=A0AAJ0MEB1_9PEZI|nr:hypothetical protein B0T25DRAFT_543306 [Lasiosphaeria hispida]
MLSRGLRLPQSLARQWQHQQQPWRAVAPMAVTAVTALAAPTATRSVTMKPRSLGNPAPAEEDELDEDPFAEMAGRIRDPFSVPKKRSTQRRTAGRQTHPHQEGEQKLTPKELKAAQQRAKRQERARKELARQGKPWVPKDVVAVDPATEALGPTVLVFSSACTALLESDFFRLARQGQHVDGWAAGMDKVLQVRSPTTREPQGQYFVFFDTRAAAEEYGCEIIARHNLTRNAHPQHDLFEPLPNPTKLPPSTDPTTTVKGYTLLPPSLSPSFTLYSRTEIQQALLAHRGARPRGYEDLWASLARDNNSNRVLVKLDGPLTTCDAVRTAIVADGYERNLLWCLREGRSGAVRPVGEPVAIKRSVFNEDEEAVGVSASDSEETGLKRFIVYFADAIEAKRFAREWHKRELLDARTERPMTVDATWLW